MVEAAVVEDLASLAGLVGAWDALAVEAAAPASSPAWMMGWWRHALPDGAALSVVAVREGGRLVGLAPFWRRVEPGSGVRLDLLAGGSYSSSVAMLAVAGREGEVGAAVARALADSAEPPDLIEVGPAVATASWPAALRDGWPGRLRPLVLRAEAISSPVTNLSGGDFDAWLAGRGRSFRSNLRRRRRWLENEGGSVRQCSAATLASDVATFVRLHAARWQSLGSSRMVAMGDGLPAMLSEVGHELGPERFRLYLLELGDRPVAAALYIAAGGEVALINTGWDEEFHRLAPLQLLQAHVVEDCLARGDRRINLGRGSTQAKLSLADGDEPVVEALMLPLGRRTPVGLLAGRRFARRCLQERVRAVMPEPAYDLLREAKRHVRGPGAAEKGSSPDGASE